MLGPAQASRAPPPNRRTPPRPIAKRTSPADRAATRTVSSVARHREQPARPLDHHRAAHRRRSRRPARSAPSGSSRATGSPIRRPRASCRSRGPRGSARPASRPPARPARHAPSATSARSSSRRCAVRSATPARRRRWTSGSSGSCASGSPVSPVTLPGPAAASTASSFFISAASVSAARYPPAPCCPGRCPSPRRGGGPAGAARAGHAGCSRIAAECAAPWPGPRWFLIERCVRHRDLDRVSRAQRMAEQRLLDRDSPSPAPAAPARQRRVAAPQRIGTVRRDPHCRARRATPPAVGKRIQEPLAPRLLHPSRRTAPRCSGRLRPAADSLVRALPPATRTGRQRPQPRQPVPCVSGSPATRLAILQRALYVPKHRDDVKQKVPIWLGSDEFERRCYGRGQPGLGIVDRHPPARRKAARDQP